MSKIIRVPDLETRKMCKFIKELSESDFTSDNHVTFDYRSKWVTPLGSLLSVSSIKKINEVVESVAYNIENFSDQAFSYACHIGYFKSISEEIDLGKAPGEANGSRTYVPITEIDFDKLYRDAREAGNYDEMNDLIEAEAKKLAGVLCQKNKELHKLFSYIIRELLRNTPEHAEVNKALIFAQYWPSKDEAQIAILDNGIGLRNSFAKNPVHREYIKTDEDALEAAIKPGISQAFNPDTKNKSNNSWSNSGFGLFMASEICRKLDGCFWLISGNKAMKVDSTGTHMYDTEFNGTAVSFDIKSTKIKNVQTLITDTAKKGEEIAKGIRNAFKEASEPSKSLLMNHE